MTTSMTPQRFAIPAMALGLSIAIGPAIAGYFVYSGMKEAKQANRYVSVKGLVEKLVKSDFVTWNIQVRKAGNDVGVLYQDMSRDQQAIKDFLIKEGFQEDEIKISSPGITDRFAQDWGVNKDTTEFRYVLVSTVSLKTKKVDEVEKSTSSISSLIAQGITITSMNCSYQITNFAELRPSLIAEATQNARAMAEQFAQNSGSQVGAIRQANQGVIQIFSPDTTTENDWNGGVGESILKKLRVVSTIEFFLAN